MDPLHTNEGPVVRGRGGNVILQMHIFINLALHLKSPQQGTQEMAQECRLLKHCLSGLLTNNVVEGSKATLLGREHFLK